MHGVQRFLQKRHLHGQLLRHRLALGLVALVHLVPEGRRGQVEGHAERIRHLALEELLQNGQEAVHRVRRRAVRRVQGPDAVKGAIYDAVAVQYHEFFHQGISK